MTLRLRTMADSLRHNIEEFLYHEAELLDDRKLREWLDLLTDDVRYWMPIRHNPLDRPENVSDELAGSDGGFYFDEDKHSLSLRIARLYLKNAWAEMPPSRTRRLISNVRVKNDTGAEFEVHSNFLVYRTRLETDQDIFVGMRKDILRRVEGYFKIAQRTIILDQAVLSAKNISVLL